MVIFTNRTIAILTATFITIVVIIGFEIWHVQQKKLIRPLAEQADSLSPSLDLAVIDELSSRPTFLDVPPTSPLLVLPEGTASPPETPAPPPSTPSGSPAAFP